MENDRLNNSLVSVCMPAYNAEEYIYDSINSILQQSYKNIELIVIDDGSIDRTGEIVKKIKDSRIKLFHTINKGQCAAANTAFNNSSGSLIKFMDADDLISKDFIKLQVARLEGQQDSVASARWGRFYKNDLRTFELNDDVIKTDCQPINWLVESMYNKQAMMQSALWLIPRGVVLKAGLWNENLNLINDFEFFIRILLSAKDIRYTENATLYYRSGMEESLSKLKSSAGAESAYNSIHLGTAHLLEYENSARIRKIAADCFQNFIYTFYPDHKELICNAEQKIKDLGGSSIPFPSGGFTRSLVNTFGWKLTKKIKKVLRHA